MDSARTCWAEGMGMDAATVEALTLVAEESAARAGDARPELDPRDVSAWPLVLEEAGQDDLAERVRTVLAERPSTGHAAQALRTIYCTDLVRDTADLARRTWGPDAVVGGAPNANPSGPRATWPFDPNSHRVVGLVAAHRSGPLFTVLVPRDRRDHGVTIVVGRGDRRGALRAASMDARNWDFAIDRGTIEPDFDTSSDAWCAVVPRGDVAELDLDSDPAVMCYEHVPADSPALAAWRGA